MSSVGTFFTYALILIAGLSILVTIHELGHYLPAKWFGMRVEKFYLFFDWPRKLFSFTKGGTEYGIGLLPLGGYVKISGIIDESMDTEHLEKAPEPYEFRAKPVWQRMIVMVGGVTMNVLLGIFIFIMIKLLYPEEKVPMANVKNGIEVFPGTIAAEIGLKTGDKVLSVNGKELAYLEDLNSPKVLLGKDVKLQVEREGKTLELPVPNDLINKLSEASREGQIFIADPPPVITLAGVSDSVQLPAYKAGLRSGDLILKVDSTEVKTFSQVRARLKNHAGQPVPLEVSRAGKLLAVVVTLDTASRMGVAPDYKALSVKRNYTLGESVVEGTSTAMGTLCTQLMGFSKMLSGHADVRKSMAGPAKIAKFYGKSVEKSGFYGFLVITGMLSLVLAFMNILPIPALDGGHLVFLLIEAVTGKEPSVKVRMLAQQIGFFLLIGLFVLIMINDIISW